MLEYLTYSNGILLYEYYHYYVFAHSLFTGILIIIKIYKTTKSVYTYFFTPNNIKQIDYNDNFMEYDGWLIM